MSIIADFLIHAENFLTQHQKARAKRAKVRKMMAEVRGGKGRKFPRKPPEAGIAAPAVPPRGPLPLSGGAEAPLAFNRD